MNQLMEGILFKEQLVQKELVTLLGPSIEPESTPLGFTFNEKNWVQVISEAINVISVTRNSVKILSYVAENVKSKDFTNHILSYICETLENVRKGSIDGDGEKGYNIFIICKEKTRNMVVVIEP
ncbi:hypothetical protein KKG48_02675 [Patescibacteria group bacterium]|nr:hypothetical protein [Patescibacteria group bacterium]MCG2695013.1 hypothetical protein [Candidatus Parcubacteria bacterium]